MQQIVIGGPGESNSSTAISSMSDDIYNNLEGTRLDTAMRTPPPW